MSNATSSSGPRLAEFVFVAFNSRAAALDRETGRIIWDWQSPKGRGFVALLLDGDHLMASVDGYTYLLNIVDAHTNYMYVYPLHVRSKSSDEVKAAFEAFANKQPKVYSSNSDAAEGEAYGRFRTRRTRASGRATTPRFPHFP